MRRLSHLRILLLLVVIAVICLPAAGCSSMQAYTSQLSGLPDWFSSLINGTDRNEVPSSKSIPTPVYVSIVIHFEESFPQQADSFASARQDLLDLARLCRQNELRFNLQPDWAFMTAMQKFETPEMQSQTNGKNILRYLSEDLNMEIDPHSHEHKYNYADVAYLLDACGVKPSNIAGGLIAAPENLCQLERFLKPFKGINYPYSWTAEYIWGGGTPGHVDEPVSSGIWWPKDSANYYVNQDGVTIPAIGRYTGEIDDIYNLVDKIEQGEAPAGQCYTACIMFNQGYLKEDLAELKAEIGQLKTLQKEGKISFVSLQELVEIWEEDFDSKGFVYLEDPQDLGNTHNAAKTQQADSKPPKPNQMKP